MNRSTMKSLIAEHKVSRSYEFQGHHANQACCKLDIMSPAYHELKGVDGEFWLRVKLE
jgi:hypothetical protein